MLNDKFCSVLVFLGICFAFYAPDAKAYLDPGTGAYVFQLLLGTFLGLSVFLSRFFARLGDARVWFGVKSIKPTLKKEDSNKKGAVLLLAK
jgi:hypothetical protein